jgi:flagellar assembly protein FliH
LSKVYKSSHVSVGAPKAIINVFKQEVKADTALAEVAEAIQDTEATDKEAEAIINDAKQLYLKIIEEANNEAQSILEATAAEAQSITASALENGYKEGYEKGYREGRLEAQSIIDEAEEIREYLDIRKEQLYKEAEEQVMQVVLDIARKVIGDELKQNDEVILALINQALQKCAFKKKLVLKVSAADYSFVSENKDRICMLVEGISDIDIVSDLSLSEGSCIVETPSGEINSSIDVQLKEIENMFFYLLRNE